MRLILLLCGWLILCNATLFANSQTISANANFKNQLVKQQSFSYKKQELNFPKFARSKYALRNVTLNKAAIPSDFCTKFLVLLNLQNDIADINKKVNHSYILNVLYPKHNFW